MWSSQLRQLRNAAAGAAEAGWAAGFGLAGRAWPAAARPWRSDGGRRVLVLAPHPDDEAVGCAGAIALHLAAGHEVRVIWATDGRLSRALGLDPPAMAARRRAEAAACANELGFAGVWLGLPEGGWRAEELAGPLAECLAKRPPDLIYAPSLVDFHPEHLRAALALALALAGAGRPTLRVYPAQVPLTALLANLAADVTAAGPAVRAALAAYGSQQVSVERSLRMRRYAAARYRRGGLAEEFWELSAERYVELHRAPTGGARFRSLRRHAWADPLAYLAGRAARRALADRIAPAGPQSVV